MVYGLKKRGVLQGRFYDEGDRFRGIKATTIWGSVRTLIRVASPDRGRTPPLYMRTFQRFARSFG